VVGPFRNFERAHHIVSVLAAAPLRELRTVVSVTLRAGQSRGRRQPRARPFKEKENLLDTIWLATSTSQLKTLWTKVSDLLGSAPTQLERDALAIPALDANGD
jgi:hypothetical protein